MALTGKVFLLALLAIAILSDAPLSFSWESNPRSTTRGELATSGRYPPATVSRASKRTHGLYLEQNGVVQPGQNNGFSFKCPKSAPNALSGYFYAVRNEADGKVLLAGSFPFGKSGRNWAVGVVNLATQPEEFVVGVICIR